MSLSNIQTVLVETFHPGNIGSAARAMKTMGLSQLVLVNPVDFPSQESERLAAGATDVLESARQVDELNAALLDSQLVVACTARPRGFDLPELTPEQAAGLLLENAAIGKVSVLYGPERFGLSNEQFKLARYRVTIPANPDYASLNLASAVQLMSYEIFKANGRETPANDARALPSTADMERFYAHLEETLDESGFINQAHPGKIMDKLRQLFMRAQPDMTELNILRGMLASFQRRVQGSSSRPKTR